MIYSVKNSFRAITVQKMRAINRTVVLEWLRSNGPAQRSQIAGELKLSPSTVRHIVDDLITDGWVQETLKMEGQGKRIRTIVKFNGADHCVIGIDLGGTKIYGAIVNFDGKILYEMYFTHNQTHSEESLQVIYRVIDGLLKVAGENQFLVEGIGIGVPGVTDSELGIVTLAPGLDWQNFPLKARLQEHYSYPVVIENDVNLAALGEVWFRPDGGGEKNLALIAIGTGIGAGIVIDGFIYSGSHHLAGEIGYLVLDRSQLGRLYPGFGAFEQIASGSGIAERAKLARANEGSPNARSVISAEDVFSAARKQEAWAVGIVSDTVDYLAQAVAAIVLLYDPEIIVLGGGVSHSADMLIEPVIKRLEGTIPVIPKLLVTSLGYRAAVMGAIIQLLRILSVKIK